MTEFSMVIIHWIDISSHDGAWMDLCEAQTFEPIEVQTCGWVVKETPEYVTVVSSLSPKKDDAVAGSINAIPRGCIQSIYPVETRR